MGIEEQIESLASERTLLREVACLAWACSDRYNPVCMTAQHRLVERDPADGEHLYNITFQITWPGKAITPAVSRKYQISDGNERLDKGEDIGFRVHDWMTELEKKFQNEFKLFAKRTESVKILEITAQSLRYTAEQASALFKAAKASVSMADVNNWLERNRRKSATQPILGLCDLFEYARQHKLSKEALLYAIINDAPPVQKESQESA